MSLFYAKSGSVWYEEVDTSLVSLLGSITVKDANNKPVPVKVVMKSPDSDIKEFPTISITHYDEKYDVMRDGREDFVISKDINTGLATKEHPAQPYNLYYQIELWAEYNLDINDMTRQLLALIGEHYSLAVVDTEGNNRTSAMDKVDYKPLDYNDEELKKYLYRRAYSYRIQVELDERPSYTEQIAKSVQVDIKDSIIIKEE